MSGFEVGLISALLAFATALWVPFLVVVYIERHQPRGGLIYVALGAVGTAAVLVLDALWIATLAGWVS